MMVHVCKHKKEKKCRQGHDRNVYFILDMFIHKTLGYHTMTLFRISFLSLLSILAKVIHKELAHYKKCSMLYQIKEIKGMKVIWIRLAYGLLAAEVLLYFCVYVYGPRGLLVLSALKKQRTALQDTIQATKSDCAAMRAEIGRWQQTDFFKEKYAREHLLMKKENETVYLHKGS